MVTIHQEPSSAFIHAFTKAIIAAALFLLQAVIFFSSAVFFVPWKLSCVLVSWPSAISVSVSAAHVHANEHLKSKSRSLRRGSITFVFWLFRIGDCGIL